jgi:predicted deacylase
MPSIESVSQEAKFLGSIQVEYHRHNANMPISIIRGKRDGPCVYIGAATHGDEINGVAICQRLIENLNPRDVRGCVVIVPVQNPFGFLGRQRVNPLDGLENDSIYPGRSDGSSTERIAHALHSHYASYCDYVIDVHTATTGGRNLPHVYVPPDVRNSALVDSFELAAAFQPDLIVRVEDEVDYGFDLTHLSPFVAATAGRRGIYVELGEGNRLEECFVERGYVGLRNALMRIGCLPKSSHTDAKRTLRVVRRVSYVKAQATGLLKLKTALGSDVTPGEQVAEIVEPMGTLKMCATGSGGFVFRIQTFGLTKLGDSILSIGHNP